MNFSVMKEVLQSSNLTSYITQTLEFHRAILTYTSMHFMEHLEK